MRLRSIIGFLAAALALGVGSVQGQWRTETFTLRPGWNAIYLGVQPEPRDCVTVFDGLNVESVWRWNKKFSPVEFIEDPSTLIPSQPGWLTYIPASAQLSKRSTLFTVDGGRPYLIKLPDASAQVTWVVRGIATVRDPEWLSDSFNLAGFTFGATPPTFLDFFGASLAHSNQPTYRLTTAGTWSQVTAPSTTRMRSGEAVWIATKGASTYPGQISLVLEQRGRIDFGRIGQEQTIRIRNNGIASKDVIVRTTTSEQAPPGSTALAGSIPLDFWRSDVAVDQIGWTNLNGTVARSTIPPGGEWALRLAIRRRDLPPSAPPGSSFQSILEVADASGGPRQLVPVTALPMAGSPAGGVGLQDVIVTPRAAAGLYVGSVSVGQVNEAFRTNGVTPKPTPTDFQFRILVHVDEGGQARLLSSVIQMWKPPVTTPSPSDPQSQVIQTPGHFVLISDPKLVSSYAGASLRDNTPVGRRYSSANFVFPQPIPMTGTSEFTSGTLQCLVELGYNDPRNPFVHPYHPDHDNWDDRHEVALEEGVESFTVRREIQLAFEAANKNVAVSAGWGSEQFGGTYSEVITGLHRNPLRVQGKFTLQLVSQVPVLNDGL